MGLNEFILGLNNLEKISRAPGFFKYTEHTVAAHSYRVASIAQVLGDIEELKGVEINWKSLYEKALNHDYTERFIGDIKTPVKYANTELRGMLSIVEEKMTEEFILQEIPTEFQEIYRRRLFEGKDETVEGEILAIADKIDLLYESFEEIVKSNPEEVYMDMFIESVQTIQGFSHRPSVIYFFDEIFPELLNKDFYGKEAFIKKINQIH
ncbi:HD domain-containing protein [Vagococcus carniphilus]|uniref:HD domain-containing protein n=1 Tax=Vagococcus carniphilus TaxID=218144 RepID=A0AAW8U4Y1_9ENTE|nr:YfbR-like 5'-deoxynucleotidase [Vagococcus carniphilus]MDT2814674.1 HD domain-containing protein [Vagococcus carniphilus]MDT2831994.1 HD domain-containing protein [Vagococcus carniphilus]MDT2834603.1 HD domain-containing protein [Vagococcus carniphilus]MDT2840865.1 HD domain-containing protein [Vagococcus carniphilus]MDT2848401.1 HD domain-containing protein [Vagococcus carniphilus]